MIVPPALYDNPQATVFVDRGEIVGAWAFALGTVQFPVSEFKPLDDGGHEPPNRLGSAQSPFSHSTSTNPIGGDNNGA